MKEFIVAFLKEEGLFTEEIGKDIYDLEIAFGPEMLAEVIKQGAGFTGDYLLLYTADVANELKKRYFTKAQQIFDKSAVVLKQKVKKQLIVLKKRLKHIRCCKRRKKRNCNTVTIWRHMKAIYKMFGMIVLLPEGLQIEEILQSKTNC